MILTAIKCPNCGKKLGDYLVGIYATTCPRCKKPIVLTNGKGYE